MDKPKKILIMRLDRLGDVVLSTPVITNLRAAFPQAYIAFMCRPPAKDAVEGNPELDEVIVYDKDGIHKNFFKTCRFASALTAKSFDWALVLHPTNRAHIIAFLAGIPVRVGWDRKMSFLLTKKIAHVKHEGAKHEVEYNLDLLRAMGVPIVSTQPVFPQHRPTAEIQDALDRGRADDHQG